MIGIIIDKYKLKPLGGGNDSEAFLTTIEGSRCVLKIFRLFSLKNLLAEIKVMNFLAKFSFPTSKPLTLKSGKQYFFWEKNPAIIYPYIPGKILEKSTVKTGAYRDIGSLMGRIDGSLRNINNIPSIRNKKIIWDLIQFESLKPLLNSLPREYQSLLPIFKKTFADYKTIKKELNNLPHYLILNDVSETNILINRGEINGLLDFSDMVYAPHICNLAVAAAHLCFNDKNWAKKLKALINGYQGHNIVSKRQLKLLPILIRARIVSLIIGNYHQQIIRGDGKKYRKVISKNIKRLKLLNKAPDNEIYEAIQ